MRQLMIADIMAEKNDYFGRIAKKILREEEK